MEFKEYLKNKKVALVGPGESTVGAGQGALIDSYDVVARLRSFEFDEDWISDLGRKTNILYQTTITDKADLLSGEKHPTFAHPITQEDCHIKQSYNHNEIIKKYKSIDWICCTYPEEEWFAYRFKEGFHSLKKYDIKYRFPSPEPYFTIKKETDRPNSGFSAIIDLLSFGISELFITGIDFYRSLYRKDYWYELATKNTVRAWTQVKDNTDSHQPDLQFRYFKDKIYNKDKRVTVDESLRKYLSDKKYENIYTA
jgi:hypothetical protein